MSVEQRKIIALNYLSILLPVSAAFIGFSSGWLSAPPLQHPAIAQVVAQVAQKTDAPGDESVQRDARLAVPFPATLEGLFAAGVEPEIARRLWLFHQILPKLDAQAVGAAALLAESLPRADQAASEPEAVLARVGELAEKDRNSVITTLIQQFRVGNPAKAIALIEQLPPQEQAMQFRMIIPWEDDGNVALFADAAERLSATLGEKLDYWSIARGLVKRDPGRRTFLRMSLRAGR